MSKIVKKEINVIKRSSGTFYNGDFITIHLKENDPILNDIRKKRYDTLLPLFLKLEDDLIKVMSNFKKWPKFERQGLIEYVRKDLSRTLRSVRRLTTDIGGLYETHRQAVTYLEQYIDNIRLAFRLNYISEGFHKELTETPAKLHKELSYVLTLLNREKGILEKKIFKDKKEVE